MSTNIRFQIGDKFYHKAPRFGKGGKLLEDGIIATIIDIHKTYSTLTGELVKVRYVASHPFMGQTLMDYDVNDTTVARNFVEDNIG